MTEPTALQLRPLTSCVCPDGGEAGVRPFPVIHMEPSQPAVTACPGMGATCISVSLWTHVLHKYLFIELVFYLIVWWAEGTCSRHLEGIVGLLWDVCSWMSSVKIVCKYILIFKASPSVLYSMNMQTLVVLHILHVSFCECTSGCVNKRSLGPGPLGGCPLPHQ